MRPSELTSYAQFMIRNRFPLLIKGKPGIGKSDILAQAATNTGASLIISHPVVSDPTDYKGLPFPKGDGTADFLPYGDLQALITAYEKTVFFLDDLGQALPSVQAACMQLLLARRINGHSVSEHVSFVAATNRREDKAGVTGILEPVKSRFASIVELEVNAEDWVQWALSNDMPTELIAYIKFRPEMLDKFQPSKDIVNSPCPRTIANAGHMQRAGLLPVNGMEFEAFKGAAGEEFATEYCTFLEVYRKLPSVDQIILNPATTPVPTEPNLQYAISFALSRRATEQNLQAVCTYLDRLPVEFSVACMKDATERDKHLCETRAFLQWSADKTGLFI